MCQLQVLVHLCLQCTLLRQFFDSICPKWTDCQIILSTVFTVYFLNGIESRHCTIHSYVFTDWFYQYWLKLYIEEKEGKHCQHLMNNQYKIFSFSTRRLLNTTRNFLFSLSPSKIAFYNTVWYYNSSKTHIFLIMPISRFCHKILRLKPTRIG
jgi:hypothetical protein